MPDRVQEAFVGIDPGGRETGIVARHKGDLLYHSVIRRASEGPWPDSGYLAELVDGIDEAAQAALTMCGIVTIAVEGVTEPSPFIDGKKQFTNVAGLVATGVALGAVLIAFPASVVCPPGGHGSHPPAMYPPDIRPAPNGRGHDRNRHARSAWDVAGAAPRQRRLVTACGSGPI